MGMVVQHNMNALSSYNKLNANVAGLKKSSEKLSSGYRINRAGDDAAGLAISEKMRSQIKGLNQAVRNSQDGISMIQTFEGAAQETHNILQRMKELASESANGTYDNATDRDAIQLEFDQLNDELNQIADTDFNGRTALNGGVMADGTVANNSKAVATANEIKYNINDKGTATIAYAENVRGAVDAAGNGKITVNGVSLEIKNGGTVKADGTAGAAEPDGTGEGSKYTIAAKALNPATSSTFTAGTKVIKAEEKFKVGADATTVTIYGQEYNIIRKDDGSGEISKLVNAQTGADVDAAKDGFTAAADGTNKTTEIVVTSEYDITADGTIKNSGTSNVVGQLSIGTDVSKPDAYNHGSRNLTYGDSITLQVGARGKDAVKFDFNYNTTGIGNLNADLDISARGLGTDQLSLATQEDANAAIDHIDNAINKTSMVRATFGSIQNRLEHKIENLTTTATNLTEAESGIRDTDMASEMMNYTKYNILQQAAQSMLAQANQQPQSILQLLG